MFNNIKSVLARSQVGQENLFVDMGSITKAKTKVDENLVSNCLDIEKHIQQGADLFSDFLETGEYKALKKCSKIFFDVMEQRPSRVEPYVYISAIFLAYEKNEDAIRYFLRAKELNPEFPLVLDLKAILFKE
jgi:hypothetical protein